MWKSLFKKGSAALVSYVCLYLLTTGSVWMFLDVFGEPEWQKNLWIALLPAGGILWWCYYFQKIFFLSVARQENGKKTDRRGKLAGVIVNIGVAFVFAAGFFWNRKEIVHGLTGLGNRVLKGWNTYYQTTLPYFPAKDESIPDMIFALVFFGLFLFWWETAVLLKQNRIFLLLLPGITVFLLDLLTGYAPTFPSMLLFLVGGIGAIPFCGGKKRLQSKAGIFGILLVACFVFCLLVAKSVAGNVTENVLEKKQEMLSYQRSMEDSVKSWQIWNVFEGKSSFVANRTPQDQQQEEMLVTMSEQPQQTVYLKGFTADTYEGGNWKNTAEDSFEEQVTDRLGLESDEAKQMIGSLSYWNLCGNSENKPVTYQLEYLDFWDRQAYIPYYVNLESAQGQTKLVADAYALRGKSKHLTLKGVLEQNASDWQASEETAVVCEAYEAYVPRYLAVKEDLPRLKALGRQLSEEACFYEMSMEETVCLARNAIFDVADYSLNPPVRPAEEDAVEYFLFDSGKGFCQHYASAGALLLRVMGIPTRYVTGYAVNEEAFVRQQDGSYQAKVLDSDAHAWVEIYVQNVGWMPVEMTEGRISQWGGLVAKDVQDEALQSPVGNNETSEEAVSTEIEQQDQPELPEEAVSPGGEEPAGTELEQASSQAAAETEKETETKTETVTGIEAGEAEENITNGENVCWNPWWSVITAVMMLLIGAGVFFCWKNSKMNVPGKERNGGKERDPREEVQILAERIYRILRRKRLVRGKNPDDRTLWEILNHTGSFEPEELRRYFSIIQRAAFDCEAIEKEDAAFCYLFYEKVKLLK